MSHGETEASSEGDDDPNHPPDEVLWTADGIYIIHSTFDDMTNGVDAAHVAKRRWWW